MYCYSIHGNDGVTSLNEDVLEFSLDWEAIEQFLAEQRFVSASAIFASFTAEFVSNFEINKVEVRCNSDAAWPWTAQPGVSRLKLYPVRSQDMTVLLVCQS